MYEIETKLSLQNFLPKTVSSTIYGEIPIHLEKEDLFSEIECEDDFPQNVKNFKINIETTDLDDITEIPLLTFIAGYFVTK